MATVRLSEQILNSTIRLYSAIHTL